jgi:hypothetical protein
VLAYVLLAVAESAGIALIPFTSIGLWIQLLAIVIYSWLNDFSPIGIVPLVILAVIVVIAELARGPSRAGNVSIDIRKHVAVAGLLGGGLGALAGFSLFPLLGSMFGALVGAALGTTVVSVHVTRNAGGWGPLIDLFPAIMLRCAASVAIAAFTLLTFLR